MPDDAERVRAIERHLLTHGRYTDTPPAPDPASRLSPVERFALGEMAGHCEYFASAMVLMARVDGLPARLVNGFAGGRMNNIGGFLELSRSDAHAWVEVHYERAGWVRYDPTPADLRMGAEPPLSLSASLRELGSALELWWFQRVVGFDRADQIKALRSAWLAWRGRGQRGEAQRAVRVPRSPATHSTVPGAKACWSRAVPRGGAAAGRRAAAALPAVAARCPWPTSARCACWRAAAWCERPRRRRATSPRRSGPVCRPTRVGSSQS